MSNHIPTEGNCFLITPCRTIKQVLFEVSNNSFTNFFFSLYNVEMHFCVRPRVHHSYQGTTISTCCRVFWRKLTFYGNFLENSNSIRALLSQRWVPPCALMVQAPGIQWESRGCQEILETVPITAIILFRTLSKCFLRLSNYFRSHFRKPSIAII